MVQHQTQTQTKYQLHPGYLSPGSQKIPHSPEVQTLFLIPALLLHSKPHQIQKNYTLFLFFHRTYFPGQSFQCFRFPDPFLNQNHSFPLQPDNRPSLQECRAHFHFRWIRWRIHCSQPELQDPVHLRKRPKESLLQNYSLKQLPQMLLHHLSHS